MSKEPERSSTAEIGIGLDQLKEELIIPNTVSLITKYRTVPSDGIVLTDIGPGDGTSTAELVKQLMQAGINVTAIECTEIDEGLFPEVLSHLPIELISSLSSPAITGSNSQYMRAFENRSDVVNMLMVIHQILSEPAQALYFARIFMMLKENGIALLTTFCPKYIDYLLENEPNKLQKVSRSTANYFSDSSERFKTISLAKLEILIAIAIACGFEIEEIKHLSLNPITHLKERYRLLASKEIPMFSTLVLRKTPKRFLSYSEGTVIKLERDGRFVIITFSDGTSRKVPFKSDLPINETMRVVLIQTMHPQDQSVITNLWSIDRSERVNFYQSISRTSLKS